MGVGEGESRRRTGRCRGSGRDVTATASPWSARRTTPPPGAGGADCPGALGDRRRCQPRRSGHRRLVGALAEPDELARPSGGRRGAVRPGEREHRDDPGRHDRDQDASRRREARDSASIRPPEAARQATGEPFEQKGLRARCVTSRRYDSASRAGIGAQAPGPLRAARPGLRPAEACRSQHRRAQPARVGCGRHRRTQSHDMAADLLARRRGGADRPSRRGAGRARARSRRPGPAPRTGRPVPSPARRGHAGTQRVRLVARYADHGREVGAPAGRAERSSSTASRSAGLISSEGPYGPGCAVRPAARALGADRAGPGEARRGPPTDARSRPWHSSRGHRVQPGPQPVRIAQVAAGTRRR